MTKAGYAGSQPSRKRIEWTDWARKHIDGDEATIERAVDAALAALRSGATANQAADAAREAAAAPPPTHAAEPPRVTPGPPQQTAPDAGFQASPGKIVGTATNVAKPQQLTGAGSIQNLEFQLHPLDGSATVFVQMRGMILDGTILEGDVVEVPNATAGSGFIKTDYAYNRTRQSPVRMQTGVRGVIGVSEARIGRKWTRVQLIVAGVIVGVMVISGVIFAIFFAFGMFWISDEARTSEINWCKDIQDAGMEPPRQCDGLI